MKPTLILSVFLLISSVASAQKSGTAGTTQSKSSLPRSASEYNLLLTERFRQLDQVLESVEWEPKREPASQMTKAEHAAEVEWSKWLLSVRNRLKEYSRQERAFRKLKEAEVKQEDADIEAQMQKMNMQFLALQESIQTESRKFTTLSNASKARHDVAMNAIRNMK